MFQTASPPDRPRRLPLVLGALLLAATAGAARAEPRKVILDDDGFSLAQWLVIKAPETQVLGVATVSGDVWQKEATANALRGVEIAGRPDIPVVPGATDPLLNSEALTERWESLYGKLVWKGAWMKHWVEPTTQALPPYHGPDVVPDLPLGNPVKQPSAERAADFMIRMVHRYPGQVSIIETGPFTNLALAQRLDPAFAGLAKELVYMGGSLNPRQTRTDAVAAQFAREFVNSPRREFNIRFDPEAASIVLRAPWRHIVMVPADPSTDTELTPDLIKRLGAADTPVAHALRTRPAGFPLWDEIAALVWLDPSLIVKKTELFIDANSQFGPGYGDILSWTPGYEPGLGERKNIVVQKVDVPRLEAEMTTLVARPQPPVSGRPLP
ncbi:nucleoside hydrolase [Nguyenibacter vanlangensis]|uniref:Nucleoside hydrolase n=1 Tax=Nguyenibacter vanlangensis TaxID=1216886 RepID=A0A7Y7M6P6_9PROT|nr:nucleoside hydrolase [Nguyenibacter vanlangensis]NVN10976.1 nucleoside hydrolase [Nguyenibacter vanlangensis]